MASPLKMKLAGQRVAAVLDAEAPAEPSIDARLAAIRALRAERGQRQRRVRMVGAGVGVAFAAALALFFTRTTALSFNVAGNRGEVGKWIASSADEATTISFSDGSELALHPAGRARVSAVSEHGALVLLEDGTVTAHVIHRADTDWRVTAGPFDVHVVGTTFDAAWSSADETLTVSLAEGRVEVTGACLQAPVAISTNETIKLSCRGVVVAARTDVEPAVSATSAPPSSASPSSTSNVNQVSSVPTLTGPTWRDLAKRGEYKQAIELLQRPGLESILSLAPAELLEVADLARLAGDPELSRQLYAKLRTAHAGTDAAAVAAFQLGRMSFGQNGGSAEQWFNLYLSERPNGALAAEALGRVLELEQNAGKASARATAQRYLERFPKGAHAAFAQKILNP